jgi:hypothetical protein
MITQTQKLIIELYWMVMFSGSNKQKKRMHRKMKRDKRLMAIIMMSVHHYPRIHVAFLSALVLQNAPSIALSAQSVHDKAGASS